jgi:hypothetical protein
MHLVHPMRHVTARGKHFPRTAVANVKLVPEEQRALTARYPPIFTSLLHV